MHLNWMEMHTTTEIVGQLANKNTNAIKTPTDGDDDDNEDVITRSTLS